MQTEMRVIIIITLSGRSVRKECHDDGPPARSPRAQFSHRQRSAATTWEQTMEPSTGRPHGLVDSVVVPGTRVATHHVSRIHFRVCRVTTELSNGLLRGRRNPRDDRLERSFRGV